MQYVAVTSISADHPCLPGHFPGNPVVPGVVILDQVFNALSSWRGNVVLSALPSVKFLSPVLPGVDFTITIDEVKPNHYNFTCSTTELTLAKGSLKVQAHSSE